MHGGGRGQGSIVRQFTMVGFKGKNRICYQLIYRYKSYFLNMKESIQMKKIIVYMKIFINKARTHRNWLSHMFESKAPQHFSGAEIDLAVRKLKFFIQNTAVT